MLTVIKFVSKDLQYLFGFYGNKTRTTSSRNDFPLSGRQTIINQNLAVAYMQTHRKPLKLRTRLAGINQEPRQ